MNQNKLIVLLSNFQAKDWRKFGQLLESGFISAMSEKQETLFEHLKDLNTQTKLNTFDKETYAKQHYPKKLVTIGHTMSELVKKIQTYISLIGFMEDEVAQFQYLQKGVEQFNLHQFEESYTNKQRKLIDLLPQDAFFHHAKLSFYKQIYFAPKTSKESNYAKEILLKNQSNLIYFSLLEILRNGVEMLSRKYYWKENFDLKSLILIQKLAQKSAYGNHPIIQLYIDMLDFLQQKGKTFQAIKEIVYSRISLMDDNYRFFVIQFLLNYAGHHLMQNKDLFLAELFDIYAFADVHNCLLENGKIEPKVYTNAVKIGIALGKYDWISQFIEKYKNNLPRSNKDAYILACGDLEFAKKEKSSVSVQLSQVETKDIFYKIHHDVFVLKSYLEAYLFYNDVEHNALKTKLSTFLKYLSRKELKGNRSEAYEEFIKIARTIFNDHAKRKMDIEKIEALINNSIVLAERTWLLNLVQRLKNKR